MLFCSASITRWKSKNYILEEFTNNSLATIRRVSNVDIIQSKLLLMVVRLTVSSADSVMNFSVYARVLRGTGNRWLRY